MVKEIVIYLEDLNFISIFLRVLMAVIFGGIIGYGREGEKRVEGRGDCRESLLLFRVGASLWSCCFGVGFYGSESGCSLAEVTS